MKIYELEPVDGWINIILKDHKTDIKKIESLTNNYSLNNKWDKVELQVNKFGEKSDFPYFWATVGALVISENAKVELNEFWSENVELLPLYLEEEIYYIVHVIEPDKLDFEILDDDYGDMYYEFNYAKILENNINEKGIFRVWLNNDKSDFQIFITDKFINKVKSSNLKGFEFSVIWESEI